MTRVTLRLAGLMAALCVASPVSAQPAPDALFDQVERGLLDAAFVEIACVVASTGAVSSSLEGSLVIREGREVTLAFTGTFADQAVDVRLESDGDRLTGQAGAVAIDQASPPALVEALVVGFTRMGILHNLARLSAGQIPDRADGGVRDFVQVSGFAREENSGQQGQLVRFALRVNGQPSGEASLLIADDGVPLQRTQRVAFPQGEMRVFERYDATVVPGD